MMKWQALRDFYYFITCYCTFHRFRHYNSSPALSPSPSINLLILQPLVKQMGLSDLKTQTTIFDFTRNSFLFAYFPVVFC